MRIYQIVQTKGFHQAIGGYSSRLGKPRHSGGKIDLLKDQRFCSPESFNHYNCFMVILIPTLHQDRIKSSDSSQHKFNDKPLLLANSNILIGLSLLSWRKVIPTHKKLRLNWTSNRIRYHSSTAAIFTSNGLRAQIFEEIKCDNSRCQENSGAWMTTRGWLNTQIIHANSLIHTVSSLLNFQSDISLYSAPSS